ncbi:hypothetical protein GcC1_154009, partial [Golovinomyces cichoracearum]
MLENDGKFNANEVLVTRLLLLRSNYIKNFQDRTSNECLNAKYSSAVRNDRDKFYGICIDTGASYHSVAGYDQYMALSKLQNIEINKSTFDCVHATFGKGSASSIGSIDMTIPFGVFTFHILKIDIPFLLSLH